MVVELLLRLWLLTLWKKTKKDSTKKEDDLGNSRKTTEAY